MKRRDVLIRAGGITTVGLLPLIPRPFGFPGEALAAESPMDPSASLEQKLADFALSIRYNDLPSDVVASCKRVLLDTFGCAFGAVGSEPVNIAERTIRETFGDGQAATIIGYSKPATIEGAVFVNGVLVRSLDLNDAYLGTDALHPSEVLPTALAISEETGANGRTLIEAMVVGYEVGARVNDAISFTERGFHPLCAASYAVPLVAGRLWNLPRNAIANAVGLSAARGYTSLVVNSGAISMMKAMGLAATAADGIFAARLASRGFTGPAGTLEWFASKMRPIKSELSVDLELARYRLPHVAFKRFPVQIELQAAAEAGCNLSAQVRARMADIREIRVETYPGIIERVADPPKFRPETRGTADHSLPVALAMALLDGDVTVAQFEKDRWRARDVMALIEKTRVKVGEALIAKRPKGRGASVEIVFTSGPSIHETVETPEGDAERPLTQASLERKFMSFAIPVVGSETAARIMSIVGKLDELSDVRQLTQATRAGGKQTL